MKYFYLLLIGLLFSQVTFAQLPDNSIAPNFALSDTEGELHVLYDYLNEGKSVVLYTFAVYDPTSWVLSDQIDILNQNYGESGTGEAVFLAMETDPMTDDDLMNNNSIGVPAINPTNETWFEQLPFPIINQTGSFEVDFQYGNSYPYIMVIYPNRLGSHVVVSTDIVPGVEDLLAEAENNNLTVGGTNNAAVVAYESLTEVCGLFVPAVSIQNLGLTNLLSADLTVSIDGSVVASNSWSGNLQLFETTIVGFPAIQLDEASTLSITLTNPNGQMDEFPEGNILEVDVMPSFNVQDNDVVLELTADQFPEDINWSVVSPMGETLYSSEPMNAGQTVTSTFTFEESGCYTFVLIDFAGDGLNSVLGAISLTSNGTVIFDDTNYGASTLITFEVEFPEDVLVVDITTPTVGLDGTVDFTATANLDIDSWLWIFDGTNSEQGPIVSNSYTQNGTYAYSLQVATSVGGLETFGGSFEITNPPIADFNFSQTPINTASIQLSNQSLFDEANGGTATRTWSFGDTDFVADDALINDGEGAITYQFNGTYEICLDVVNEYGSDQHCETVTVSDAWNVGVEDLSFYGLSFYPNPAQDFIVIEGNQTVKSVAVYSIDGRLEMMVDGQNQLDIGTLSSGLYFITILLENNERAVASFVKE